MAANNPKSLGKPKRRKQKKLENNGKNKSQGKFRKQLMQLETTNESEVRCKFI